MAKGKRSVALFEVIHKDQRFAKPAGRKSVLQTPSWWFKQKAPIERVIKTDAELTEKPAIHSATNHSTKQVIAVEPKPSNHSTEGGVTEKSAPATMHSSSVGRSLPREKTVESPLDSRSSRSRSFDRQRDRSRSVASDVMKSIINRATIFQQSISSRYPQIAGPLYGIAAAMAVSAGILFARHVTRPVAPSPDLLASANTLRLGPAHPQVLRVYDPIDQPKMTPRVAQVPDAPRISTASAQPATNTTGPAAREVNLNYVLIQSYADEKWAVSAADFCNRGGVPCTVERNIKHWSKQLYLVIGLKGFTRVSGPEYTAYRRRIETLSEQFAPHSSRGFSPIAIKWDKTN